jgi:voltage-gated sodium channel
MTQKPFAWVFFVTYILIATFSVLNLFIAVVVDAMQRNHQDEPDIQLEQQAHIQKKLDAILHAITKK